MMRAAILLECDKCGGRWCWPAFDRDLSRAVNQAVNAIEATMVDCCPACGAFEGSARRAAGVLGEQAERAAGRVFLDGRPKGVAS
jgi:hypothetical protein